MSILSNKKCPKCGKEDALSICVWTNTVNCNECLEVIRLLTKDERIKLYKELKKIMDGIKGH